MMQCRRKKLRVTGLEIRVVINFLQWYLLPQCNWLNSRREDPHLHWLCFESWLFFNFSCSDREADNILDSPLSIPKLLYWLNRYAKHPDLFYVDRQELYSIKTERIKQLYEEGKAKPTSYCFRPGSFQSADLEGMVDYAHNSETALDTLKKIWQEAATTKLPVDWTLLDEMGIPPSRVIPSLEGNEGNLDWYELSPRNYADIDPQGMSLVVFLVEEGYRFHLPYRVAEDFVEEDLTKLPEGSSNDDDFGQPPTEEEQRQWPIETIVEALGFSSEDFPRSLALKSDVFEKPYSYCDYEYDGDDW